MEMGVGIHGEPGRRRVKLATADAIADEMVGAILKDLAPKAGTEVILLVNGFGGTPSMELYLMVNSARRVLDPKRGHGGTPFHRFLRYVPGDGGLLRHRKRGGCELPGLVGRSGAYGSTALGHVVLFQDK